jgi:hypothetical protein
MLWEQWQVLVRILTYHFKLEVDLEAFETRNCNLILLQKYNKFCSK